MRLGLSLTTSHAGLNAEEAMRTSIARTRAAAAGELDHLTVGDNHAIGRSGLYLQGVPTLGRLLAEWPEERQAGLLFLLPLWHPVMVAEMIGTLAAMGRRRIIVQTGIGSGAPRFAAMGADLRTRGKVTDESLRVVNGLLRGETVSSTMFGLEAAEISPRPAETVEWWIGAGQAPKALERAATFGDALYLGPHESDADVARIMEQHGELCAARGRPSRVVVRRDVLVGDDDAAIRATGDRIAAAGYRGLPRELLLCGGVDRVVELLSPLAALGVDAVAARTLSAEPGVAERSVELLGSVREGLA